MTTTTTTANLNRSRADRDIADGFKAETPTVDELAERAACERDFRRFCATYFPAAFNLAWSDDHLRAIERIESAVLDGGMFALEMPRGSGKTTLCERAALWALLYGHRRFVCMLGSTGKRAGDLLDHLKIELLFNEHLRRPFRSVCYPIRRLENNARKAIGQLFNGEQTRITWASARLTLPTMPDDACDGVNVSGSIVTVAGLTGALRGQSHTLASGEVIRPELVLIDDPQTRDSAMSPSQCADRLAIVAGDVLGLAGPGRKVAALMPCTVIREGDLADRILDREKHPEWNGERTAAGNKGDEADISVAPEDAGTWADPVERRKVGDMLVKLAREIVGGVEPKVEIEQRLGRIKGRLFCLPDKGPGEDKPTPTDVVVDMLVMVGVEDDLPEDEIEAFVDSLSVAERESVADWAGAIHLRASDNDVDVPPQPECLKRLGGHRKT
jgi:hypothetical protein